MIFSGGEAGGRTMIHPNVRTVDNALLRHKLALMRDKDLPFPQFKALVYEAGLIIGSAALADLPTKPVDVETPVGPASGEVLVHPDTVIVAVLRGGLVMASALQLLLPTARTGHLGLFRERGKASVTDYLVSLPRSSGSHETDYVLVDPMIATGATIRKAAQLLRENGIPGNHIRIAAIIAAAPGISHFFDDSGNSQISMYVGAVDPQVDHRGYIVPGLGDSGDRQFGTIKPSSALDSGA